MVKIGQDIIDVAARAMWQSLRSGEIEQISSFAFDAGVFGKAREIFATAGPREQVIVGFSLISMCLDAAFRYNLSHANKSEVGQLLDGLGPLSSDAAKMRLAKALGWIGPDLAKAADEYRSLRNKVSHEVLSFSGACAGEHFSPDTSALLERKITTVFNAVQKLPEKDGPILDLDRALSFGGFALILAERVLTGVVAGPGRLRLGVSAGRVEYWGAEDGPDWHRDVVKAMIRALLELGQIEEDG